MKSFFCNRTFNKNEIKKLIHWFLLNYGPSCTLQMTDELKNLGFSYSTKAGLSIGIDDLKTPSIKPTLIENAEEELGNRRSGFFNHGSEGVTRRSAGRPNEGAASGRSDPSSSARRSRASCTTLAEEILGPREPHSLAPRSGRPLRGERSERPEAKSANASLREKQSAAPVPSGPDGTGNASPIHRFQKVISVWNNTSNLLKEEVIENFRKSDRINSLYMMAFSGARGNMSQVRQLVGMRGLMADPKGEIIDVPIKSNFREGLTLTEYIISCYGARKGLVDTALSTANAGYLTRRLIDVAHAVIISDRDCKTDKGILLGSLRDNDNNQILVSLEQRLVGRVLAFDTDSPLPFNYPRPAKKKLVKYKDRTNHIISFSVAQQLSRKQNHVLVRSPLRCQSKKAICQLCYGWNLAHGRLVHLGEAVGILAGQSIGEPGTQLTMRTFHTGGVFSGGSSNRVYAPHPGFLFYSNKTGGKFIQTDSGDEVFLLLEKKTFVLRGDNTKGLALLKRKAKQVASFEAKMVSSAQAEGVTLGASSAAPSGYDEILVVHDEARASRSARSSRAPLTSLREGPPLTEFEDPSDHRKLTTFVFPPYTMILVPPNQLLNSRQVIAELSSSNKKHMDFSLATKYVLAQISGQVFYQNTQSSKSDKNRGATLLAKRRLLPRVPRRSTPALAPLEPLARVAPKRCTSSGLDPSISLCSIEQSSITNAQARLASREAKHLGSTTRATTLSASPSSRTTSVSPSRSARSSRAPSWGERAELPIDTPKLKNLIWVLGGQLLTLQSGFRQGDFFYNKRPQDCFLNRRALTLSGPTTEGAALAGRMKGDLSSFDEMVVVHDDVQLALLVRAERDARATPEEAPSSFAPSISSLSAAPSRSARSMMKYSSSTTMCNSLCSFEQSSFASREARLGSKRPEGQSRQELLTLMKSEAKPSKVKNSVTLKQGGALRACALVGLKPLNTEVQRFSRSEGRFKNVWIYLITKKELNRFKALVKIKGYSLVCQTFSWLETVRFQRPKDKLNTFLSKTIIQLKPYEEFIDGIRFSIPVYIECFSLKNFKTSNRKKLFNISLDKGTLLSNSPSGRPAQQWAPGSNAQARHDGALLDRAERDGASSRTTTISAWGERAELPWPEANGASHPSSFAPSLVGDEANALRTQDKQRQDLELCSKEQSDFYQSCTQNNNQILNLFLTQSKNYKKRLKVRGSGGRWVFEFPTQKMTCDTRDTACLASTFVYSVNSNLDLNFEEKTYILLIRKSLKSISFDGAPLAKPGFGREARRRPNPRFARSKGALWSSARSSRARCAPLLLAKRGEMSIVKKLRNYLCTNESAEIQALEEKTGCLFKTKTNRFFLKIESHYLVKVQLGEFVQKGDILFRTKEGKEELVSPISGKVVMIKKGYIEIQRGIFYQFLRETIIDFQHGSIIKVGKQLFELEYKKAKTEDIIQGLPKINALFEARQAKLHKKLKTQFLLYKGYDNIETAVRKSVAEIQEFLVDSIQIVYQSQGVKIADKHIEIIVKMMTSKVLVKDSGDSCLLPGELVELKEIEKINSRLKTKADYEPKLVGITKVCLDTQSFISAASFQETTRILTRASIECRQDWLQGLKENVILGTLIPAGTGF